MEPGNLRNDQPYRRGLVLGLTMAEVMLLLVFVLLMAMGAALAHREQDVQRLRQAMADQGLSARLHALLQETFPHAADYDSYFKELRLLEELRDKLGAAGAAAPGRLVRDAELGALLREAAGEDAAALPRTVRSARRLLGAQQRQASNWPPFISLSEADGYVFDSGSAELGPELRNALMTTTADGLARLVEAYGVDVIEVIGHTDEVPMFGASTLDRTLIPAVRGSGGIAALRSCDNAGLGMARAVSVVRVLQTAPGLDGVTILPLSAAQMIVPVDTLADGTANRETPGRRRIEIRLRRSTDAAALGQLDRP